MSSPTPTNVQSDDPEDLYRQNIFSSLVKQLKENQNASTEDECCLFGKQVALDLKGLNLKNRAVARYQINKVLMELLLEERGYPSSDL